MMKIGRYASTPKRRPMAEAVLPASAPAAAMGMMIFYTAASVRLVHFFVAKFLQRRTQAWRRR